MKVNRKYITGLFLIAILQVFSSCGDNKSVDGGQVPVNGKEIPLGGNTYITSNTQRTKVEDEGVTAWSDPETVFSTYFRVNRAGSLNLYLKYHSATEGNTIEVRCKEEEFKVSLPGTNESEKTVFIGTVECETGYVQVDFRGINLKENIYCKPTSLIVDGSAAADMNYVDDFSYYWGRRGPSVHMSYTIPQNITAEWFYNEITVPVGSDPIGSYFMSNGFGEGYFGIQVNSKTERRVLFSVWSPYETDDPNEIPDEHKIILVKKGEEVYTGEFGNEGSGGQSFLRFNWKAGETYKFLTHVCPVKNGYTEYTSYFFAPEINQWKLIAQFLRPGTTTYYTRPHSFLENFDNTKGYLQRKAFYNNQWIYTKEGEWIELTEGKFTADATAQASARMDYKGGVNESGFLLQNCGFFDDFTTINSTFNRPPTKNRPSIIWDELE